MTSESEDSTQAPISMNKKLPSGKADISLGLCIAAMAVFLYILTNNWTTSAAVFPRIVAGILFVLALINAWQGFCRLGVANQDTFLPKPLGFVKIWLAIPLYFAAVWVIGFPIATVLLIVGIARLFGFKKWHQSLIAGVVFVAIMLAVFTGLFDRPLPLGLLFAPFFD